MPDWKEEIRSRLSGLDLDPSREAAIVEELSQHAAERCDELMRQGVAPSEAQQQALTELGDARLGPRLAQVFYPKAPFGRRFPFSLRILAKHWKLTGVAVVSLAIAMAATVAGLSLFNALLLRPPMAASPGRLLAIYARTPSGDGQQMSFPEYKFYRENNRTFSGLAAFNYGIGLGPVNLDKETLMVVNATVSENYFDVLGVHPAAGRFFSGDDSALKREMVLSYPFWQRLGGDPSIVGKVGKSGKDSATIVGVAPKGFVGTVAGFSVDAWYPIRMATNSVSALQERDNRWLTLVGRLKPGITRSQVQADVSTLAQQLAHDFPESNKDCTAGLRPLTMLPSDQLGLARMLSWTVMGVVLLVLLAACANVVNLLLGLATARRQEMLIRAALGASRSRLIRQLLQETAIVCVSGSIIGFSLAWYGLEQLLAFRPVISNGIPPLLLDFRPDFTVASLTVAVMIVLTAAVGLLPALSSSTPNLAGAMNGEIAVGGTRKRRARNILVIMQTAVCTLVLVGAGLCLRSIEYLKKVPLGFSARKLVFTYVSGPDDAKPQVFYEMVRRETAALPGVLAVTRSTSLPLSQNGAPDRVVPEGRESEKDQWVNAHYNVIDDNYFSVLGLAVLSGRAFDSTDGEHNPEVVIINHTLAEKYWPGQSPVGKRLRIERGNRLVQIVGIVADSKYDGLDEPQLPFMYLAVKQHPQEAVDLALTVATSGKPSLWIDPVVRKIHEINPAALCFFTGTFEDQINFSLLLPRIIFACVGGFGLLALVLSMAGIFATTSYAVGERKREIGIRLALGAQPRQVMTSLLRQAALVTGIGLAAGLGLGVAMSSLLGSLLFGIRPVEWPVLVCVAVFTVSIALATAYLAARPWVKIDPLEAVRHI
jgi:putative ABC transport system permease protein